MSSGPQYEFGPFRLDAAGRILFRNGKRLALTPKAVELLVVLVEAQGNPVSKEELLHKVWADAVVEEGSLTSHISILRKALGEGVGGQQFIETIPKRGYRFVGQVTKAAEETRHAADRFMLAVLPFENLSAGEKHDYFSEGLTEEMISQLARLSPERLGVIARTSAMQYKSTTKTIQQIGKDLGVSYVLEGSVRRAEGRVRIAAQLIQVSDESHLWAETYERDLGDILKIQSEVSQAVAREIRVKLTAREQRRLSAIREVSPTAYEAYLRGRHLWNKRTEDGMRKSILHYEEAIRNHSEYAMAYVGLADSYVMLACRGMAPAKETFLKAKVAARKALELDCDLAEAHGSLAHVRLHDWDWEKLEEHFQRAIELNPAEAIVYYWFGEFLMSRGRPEEAIAVTRQAHKIDPLSPVIGASLGMILYLARRYEEAAALLQRTREINPDHFLPHLRLAYVRVQQRRFDEAIRGMQTAVNLADRSTETLAALAVAYAAAGKMTKAKPILAELERPAGKRYVLPYNIAKIYSAARKAEEAFDWLETAYNEGNADLIELNSEPIFDSIRGDSRFSDLMRRVGWNA